MNWSDYVGWFGFAVVLFSYAQVALRRWRVRSVPNQVGNIVGPGSLGVNSLVYHAWIPVVLNIIWVSVACFTLIQLLRQKEKIK
ncbi:MAG: hypothetical protein A3H42_00985 [Deltaproteobacteria bacterium RIFCSPLOWO2_02_FULL_46_8]|nr:MAG: hypothetical protein A3H42_00985 [Deltaproteobacteria bacterium RIFCSPLOWO2_02_FULL_46_8]